jgi:pimeloyl-ACP methyl ester carboxylesterase
MGEVHCTRMKTLARALAALLTGLLLAVPGQAQDKTGVILMHGKQGSPAFVRSGLPAIAAGLQGDGDLAILPTMPWSIGAWETIRMTVDQAFDLIDGYAARLRGQGATRIVVAGQSLGANIALSYAVERGNVAAVVMAAPGHNPGFLYRSNDRVRMDVDRALDLVKDGRGDQSFSGPDNNQGNNFTVSTTAAVYASWMNPRGKASMDAQAPRLPASIPLLMIVGDRDPAYGHARTSWYAPAAKNPYSRYLTVSADHVATPAVASRQIIDWINGLPR